MSAAPVVTSGGVTLVGGGAVGAGDWDEALTLAPLLVAADGGADAAIAAGHLPAAVIGDFDSITADARRAIPPERQHCVAEQDSTDFEKCLARIDARFVIAIGFAGSRLDHTLAVLSVMARLQTAPVLLLTEADVVFVAPPHLALPLQAGIRVSLWPMAPVRATGTGLRWPVDGIDFAPAGRIGTSNEATGPVSLSVDGPLLVLLPRAQLGLALSALL